MGGRDCETALPNDSVDVWVVGSDDDSTTWELLGDACDLAGKLRTHVGLLAVGRKRPDSQRLIHGGADLVHWVNTDDGPEARLAAAGRVLPPFRPRLVLTSRDGRGRELAARLAVQQDWRLISPALMATAGLRRQQATSIGQNAMEAPTCAIEVTAIDATGRRTRVVEIPHSETAIVTMRPGVAVARPLDATRTGRFEESTMPPVREAVVLERVLPADPQRADIRDLPRLVAGGQGVGGREGFELLGRLAERLGAGVAASRAAVDRGWIEHARQVGQSGRTVKPNLYIACGISGASHHVQGMSESQHIVAINTDPEAPIFRVAHLGLCGDLFAILAATLDQLET
jgi:electron transfer flavoprotein alpha subunit